MKTNRMILAAAAAAGFFAGSVYAQSATSPVNPMDRRFITKTAQDNQFEIELGQIAKNKSTNADVRAFADRMVTDHGNIQSDLKPLAAKWNVALPTDAGEKHRDHIKHFQSLSGEQFDTQYMSMMVKNHQTDVAAFQKMADKGQNEDLKTFATRHLPTLKEHLKQAEDIQTKIQKRTQTGAKRASALP